MSLPRSIFAVRPGDLSHAAVIFLLLAIAPSALRAQDASAPPSAPQPPAPQAAKAQPFHLEDYSKPRSAFPHILQPYMPRPVDQPNLGNSPRIDTLMHDGKIYLSIDDAVALTLENNLDIDLARYNLNIADTDFLRAKSGANILGVNAGIVQ
ncbi:MAG: hypothetical protein WAO10_17195, partial [Candidatus Sulfotelmatobacter sp.]